MKVVSFGEILLRLMSPGYTKLFQKDFLESSFCGGEANVAVSLAILGLDSSFITKVPDSDVGHAALNSMRYFGVDTSNSVYGEGRMGLYYLEKGASQRPSKVIYDRAYSAIALAKREDFDWNIILEGADWFHWTGINPALSVEMSLICEDACNVAKSKGITVSCDLNYRAKLWTSEQAQLKMKPLMKYVDVCICNEEDASNALGIKMADVDVGRAELNEKSYVQTAKLINQLYGCKYIATTLRKSFSASSNGWGAMLYDSLNQRAYLSKNYEVQIVDRVGSGDSFAAGLIYAMSQKFESQDIVEFATAASCLKHSIEGDYNRTTVSEVFNLLNSGGNGRVQR